MMKNNFTGTAPLIYPYEDADGRPTALMAFDTVGFFIRGLNQCSWKLARQYLCLAELSGHGKNTLTGNKPTTFRKPNLGRANRSAATDHCALPSILRKDSRQANGGHHTHVLFASHLALCCRGLHRRTNHRLGLSGQGNAARCKNCNQPDFHNY